MTFALLLAGVAAGHAAAAAEAPLIAIDVGHSLARPGAISARGRPEFEFNRELAVVVERTLHAYGFRTRLIAGQGDVTGLTDRTAAAAGADFFLSIHHEFGAAAVPGNLDGRRPGAEMERPLLRLLAVRLAQKSASESEPCLRQGDRRGDEDGRGDTVAAPRRADQGREPAARRCGERGILLR